MRLIFIDEAGYTPEWTSSMEEQPYYVLSAIVMDSDGLPDAYMALRAGEQALEIPQATVPLGQGREIKAREVATGAGWWRNNNGKRNGIRDLMLSWPRDHGGVAFLVVVDKAAHYERYYYRKNPYMLALQFLLERVQHHLSRRETYGYCIYDQNRRLETDIHSRTADLLREGSEITYYSSFYGVDVRQRMALPNILELALGNSHNSLGLQVADFFATFAYQYYKQGTPDSCGWWETLEDSLERKDGKLTGVGLKSFPD